MPFTKLPDGLRAKFRVTEICQYADFPGIDVILFPVYSSAPGSEDKIYWESHPAGEIKIHVKDKAAIELFSPGANFYVDFIRAKF